MASASVVERVRKMPKPEAHEGRVEDAVDRLMLVEVFIMWHIQGLEDLRTQLSRDPLLKQLTPIVELMISQLWQLMRRWSAVKAEVIRKTKEELIRMERRIEGDGFTIYPTYHKGVIDLKIYLSGSGDNVRIPNLGIDENILKAIRMGWRASDEGHGHNRYPEMTTTFAWQVISWLIAHPNTEAWIHAQSISVAEDGIKPVWRLRINGFEAEWSSDIDAYQEMVKLPRGLFEVALLHSIFGDGSNNANNARKISLYNDNYTVLEELRTRLEGLGIEGTITPGKGAWFYWISGPSARKFAETAVKAMEELAPVLRRLYDLLTGYELIKFEKWSNIIKMSRYVMNQSKVWFANQMWSLDFTPGSIKLSIATVNADYAEEVRRRLEIQGITAVITNYVKKNKNTTYYMVKINWTELKKFLCNEGLREQLVRSAERAVENCRAWNMTHPGKKKDCDKILAAQWLRKLQNPRWLRENLKCGK